MEKLTPDAGRYPTKFQVNPENKEKRLQRVSELKQDNRIITDEKIIRTYFLKEEIDDLYMK